jgi:hypothetical protein
MSQRKSSTEAPRHGEQEGNSTAEIQRLEKKKAEAKWLRPCGVAIFDDFEVRL